MTIPIGPLIQAASQARNAYVGGQKDRQQDDLAAALMKRKLEREEREQSLRDALTRGQIEHQSASTSLLRQPQDKWEKVETDDGIYEWNPRTHETRRMVAPAETQSAGPSSAQNTPNMNGPTGDIDLSLPDKPQLPVGPLTQRGLQPKKTTPSPDRELVPVMKNGKRIYVSRAEAAGQEAPAPAGPAPDRTIVPVQTPDGPKYVGREEALGQAPPLTGQGAGTMKAKVAENRALLKNIQETIAAVQANPTAFGIRNMLGDKANQLRDPNGVAVRARVANIGSMKIHERNGSAVSPKEFQRTAPFVPTDTDQSDAIVTKLTEMAKGIAGETDEMEKMGGAGLAPRGGGRAGGGRTITVNGKTFKVPE